MDAENDNDQPNSSSTSSSNNSSSSNLLVNLPMLPMLDARNVDDNDEDLEAEAEQDEREVQLPMQASRLSMSPPQAVPPAHGHQQQQQQPHGQPVEQEQASLPDNSVFISPLLFNNSSTPPPSSSSSSSSSSSHNLHLYHHHHQEPLSQQQQQQQQQQEQQNQPEQDRDQELSEHSEHSHQHQHSPPPSFSINQQHASSSSSSSVSVQEHQQALDELHSAQAVEAAANDIELNADIASTSNQQQSQTQQQSRPASIDNAVDSIGVSPPLTPPRSLPLLLHQTNEPKESHASSSPSFFAYHPFTHPNPLPSTPLQHQLFGSFGGSNNNNNNSNNIFGFDALAKNCNNNGTAMFSNNDNSGPHSSSCGNSHHHQHQVVDRLKLLYPNVNEDETPLPRCWSPHDKCLSIGLSQHNLRVHYKGIGKQHNDAASVRTAHPIPPACGLYYFEVKIISKGKNGYMGIGLTAQNFRMNRLPGWDKQSYGYHGDDGHSFSSSGNGQSYGPTFTTGDIIGCCVNFVDNTCFYTKNGIHLGIAFRDLPTRLYPTVGLQTPGEEVDANFGQEPFKFDQIEDMMKEMRAEMKTAIYDFPMPADHGDPTTLLHKMVSSYLVHNGHSQTAEAFARSTGQTFREDLSSIRNRQKILKLCMSGKIGQAIDITMRLYPGLLESNANLWFMLKCRQFIEMVNGSDIEYCPSNNKLTTSATTQTTPPNQTSVIQSTKSYQNGKCIDVTNNAQNSTTTTTNQTTNTTTISAVINADNHQHQQQDLKNSTGLADTNCSLNNKSNEIYSENIDYINDVEMENNGHVTNGNVCKNGNANVNSFSDSIDADEDMDVDVSPSSRKYSHTIERILEFGKELSQMGQQLEKENKMTDEDRQMLEDAFSLIAYSNPWSSPLGWQLCPTKRENVCKALNSAILEAMNYPRRPPLEVCVAHASELLKVMAQASLGACAFVNIEDIFPQN